jgi:hypothetical protein
VSGSGVLSILPIIAAGFVFNLLWLRLRVLLAHAEGQQVFFSAATSGLLIALVAFLAYDYLPIPAAVISRLSGLPLQHAGELLFTLILAVFFGLVMNRGEYVGIWLRNFRRNADDERSYRERLLHHLTKKYGNPMKRFFVEAFERQSLVLLSLRSRKVYCGKLVRMTTLSREEDQFVEILPIFSDVRDSETLKFSQRTEYPALTLWELRQRRAVLQELLTGDLSAVPASQRNEFKAVVERELADIQTLFDERSPGERAYADRIRIDDWVKHIPLADIEIASVYDKTANALWFASPTPPAPPDSKPAAPPSAPTPP